MNNDATQAGELTDAQCEELDEIYAERGMAAAQEAKALMLQVAQARMRVTGARTDR